MHLASRWTAYERPAWRSLSPAATGNNIRNILKTTFEYSYRWTKGIWLHLWTLCSYHMAERHHSQQSLTAGLDSSQRKRPHQLLHETQNMKCGGVLFAAWGERTHKKHTVQVYGQPQNHILPSSQQERQMLWVKICHLTSCLLHFFDAELGCGHCSRVMAWCIIRKQEVTTSENGANTLLCCFTDLRGRQWT